MFRNQTRSYFLDNRDQKVFKSKSESNRKQKFLLEPKINLNSLGKLNPQKNSFTKVKISSATQNSLREARWHISF